MSLINDALKKAARQRAEEQADVAPPMPGGGHRRISRQGEPMKTQTMVLIGGAAIALIVVSAVMTGIFITGKTEQKPVSLAQLTPAAPPPSALKVVVQAPVIALPQTSQPSPPPPTSAPVVAARPTPAPTPAARRVEASTISSAPAIHNELIQGIVDRYRISGARAAGSESKALVDGHVYKLNEVIDKTLGLRLVKVDTDHLTFVDSDGATYIRSF